MLGPAQRFEYRVSDDDPQVIQERTSSQNSLCAPAWPWHKYVRVCRAAMVRGGERRREAMLLQKRKRSTALYRGRIPVAYAKNKW